MRQTVTVPTAGRVFVVLIAIHALAVTLIVILQLLFSDNSMPYYPDLLYANVLILILSLFFVYFGVSAVIRENAFQLGAFILATFVLTARFWPLCGLSHVKESYTSN
jgi:predicted neutral ceramidase superfamily lipid hydrolase